MGIIDKLRPLIQSGAIVYSRSHYVMDNGELIMLQKNGRDILAVSGLLVNEFIGFEQHNCKLCECTHENRVALNHLLPFTAPVSFGRNCASFGFGDRLGFANPAQIRCVSKTCLRPVLAQQSQRELQLIGRKLSDVIDIAAWSVLREGYQKGYACDGDHLKTLEEVLGAVEDGCTMVTLDCSLVLKNLRKSMAEWESDYASLSDDIHKEDRTLYLNSSGVQNLGLHFTEAMLGELHTIYDEAVKLCQNVYKDAILPSGRTIDLEVSLDETSEITTPEAHYYVATQLEHAGVFVTSIAPKFVGEFQKAIDYIGDVTELQDTMQMHAAIANHFGYKLSLHSGSEKFTALPILAEATGNRYHVKTSGTSWLEAVETISKNDPSLYRRMHTAALRGVEAAKRHYAVHCDLQNIPPLDSVDDIYLPNYLKQNDSRQLMHITYGHILSDPELKKAIFDFLIENRDLYESEAEELYQRHLSALNISKI